MRYILIIITTAVVTSCTATYVAKGDVVIGNENVGVVQMEDGVRCYIAKGYNAVSLQCIQLRDK